jgi:hypothetical protein
MPTLGAPMPSARSGGSSPRLWLVILITYDTDEDIELGLKAGAQAYLLEDVTTEDLVTCILVRWLVSSSMRWHSLTRTKPRLIAVAIASVRLVTCSFPNRFVTFALTVASLIPSSSAISLFALPGDQLQDPQLPAGELYARRSS